MNFSFYIFGFLSAIFFGNHNNLKLMTALFCIFQQNVIFIAYRSNNKLYTVLNI